MFTKDSLVVFTPAEIDLARADGTLDEIDEGKIKAISNWTEQFLCEPNGALGRVGPVCPFTRPALKRQTLWLTAERAETLSDDVAARIARFRDWFLQLPPTSGSATQYKTVLIVFTRMANDVAAGSLDEFQRKLKPDYVQQGLMVGQFYASCPEKGLWNDEFRPLQAPVPVLAIREMVPSDFPFLIGTVVYMDAYLKRYAPQLLSEVRKKIVAGLASDR